MALFLYSHWLQLPINTRHKLAQAFNIPKKGPTEVFDNQIKADGYLIKDIEGALSIDAIQRYLDTSETDMLTLWLWMVDKVEGREPTKVNLDTTSPLPAYHASGEVVATKKKAGRPKKK